MPNFKNLKQLEKYLKHEIENSIRKDVAEMIEQEVRDKIDELVYSKPTKSYERTMELRNSVSSDTEEIKKDLFELRVFNDVELINPYKTDNFWNQHMSMNDEDVSHLISLWILKGTSGSPYYNHESRDYIQATKDELKNSKKHVKALQSSLKRKGIDVEC